MLVRAGLIDEMQLQSVLAHQRQWGGRIGDILVEQGFLDEMMLWRGLSRQLSLPLVSLADWPVNKEALAALPIALARAHDVFPYAVEGQKLIVATSDPGDVASIDEIAFRTSKSVRPVLAPPREIAWALDRFYRNVLQPCPPPRQKARVGSAASEERFEVVHRGGAVGLSLGVSASTSAAELRASVPLAPPQTRAPVPYSTLAQVSGGSAQSVAEDELLRASRLLRFAVEACAHRGIFTREEFAARLDAAQESADHVFASPSAPQKMS
jgi:hypothetical protein